MSRTRTPTQVAPVSAETSREDWWHMLPLRERERAIGVAGMARERASMPLATFSDVERERVRLAIQCHLTQMEMVMRCMAASNTNLQGYLH